MKKKSYDFKQREETRMVKVKDDWYPCFEGGYVRLKIGQYFFKDHYCIISAWGEDDTGVEMMYSHHAKEAVDAVYDRWKKYIFDRVPDGVTREWFYEHGFLNA